MSENRSAWTHASDPRAPLFLRHTLKTHGGCQRCPRGRVKYLQVLLDELLYERRGCSGCERVGGNVEDGFLALLGTVHILLQADEVITTLGGGEAQQLCYLLPADMAWRGDFNANDLGKRSSPWT